MRIRKPLVEIVAEAQAKTRYSDAIAAADHFTQSVRAMHKAIINAGDQINETLTRIFAALPAQHSAKIAYKPKTAEEFLEAQLIKNYEVKIEMERQLGLKFIRDLADKKRDELGLPRVHYI